MLAKRCQCCWQTTVTGTPAAEAHGGANAHLKKGNKKSGSQKKENELTPDGDDGQNDSGLPPQAPDTATAVLLDKMNELQKEMKEIKGIAQHNETRQQKSTVCTVM